MWTDAYVALQDYIDLFGEAYEDIALANATGVEEKAPDSAPSTGATQDSTPPSSGSTTPATDTDETKTQSAPTAPSLTQGSYVEVKDGTKWYGNSSGGGSSGKAKSGTIKYINEGASHPYNIDGGGWIKKTDIVGYASGTDNATPGLHELFEGDKDEYVFTSKNGQRYKMFSGLGDKVLNAKATDFLYDFATSGGSVIANMISDFFKSFGFDKISKPVYATEIQMGDIIVQGNATAQTVSEIRRAQRDETTRLLKEFSRLGK